ncbi:MAG: rolling circle replication-associated protein [bacterium]
MANNLTANQNVLNSKGTSDFNPVDFFNSYNKRPYSYDDSYVIAGNYVERRKYSNFIYCNYISEFPDSKKGIKKRTVNTNNEADDSKNNNNDSTSRSNRRRIKKLKNIIRCNNRELTTFITITLGDVDYKELVSNSLKKHHEIMEDVFPEFFENQVKILDMLSGIKKIDKLSNDDDFRLDKNDYNEFLREKIIAFLSITTNKKSLVEKRVRKEDGSFLPKKRITEKINRKIPLLLDDLIFDGNPYSIDDANHRFKNFKNNGIKTLLNNSDSDIEKFKYLKVIEFQKNKRIHFHILCNLPYIDQWELQKSWGNGIVNISRVDKLNVVLDGINFKITDKRNLKYYKMQKYLSKEVKKTSRYISGNQLYTTSSGLNKPIRINNPYLLDYVRGLIKELKIKPENKYKYNSDEEHGVDYRCEEYRFPNYDLYYKVYDILQELYQEMEALRIAKKENLITQEIFDEVMINHGMGKDFGAE